MHGWIGGSCTRSEVIRHALEALRAGEPRLLAFGADDARSDDLVKASMSCASGGGVEVHINPVLPAPVLLVAGDSPVALALVRLGRAMGYRTVTTASADEGGFESGRRARRGPGRVGGDARAPRRRSPAVRGGGHHGPGGRTHARAGGRRRARLPGRGGLPTANAERARGAVGSGARRRRDWSREGTRRARPWRPATGGDRGEHSGRDRGRDAARGRGRHDGGHGWRVRESRRGPGGHGCLVREGWRGPGGRGRGAHARTRRLQLRAGARRPSTTKAHPRPPGPPTPCAG